MRHTTLLSMLALPALVGCASSSPEVGTAAGPPRTTRVSGVQSSAEMRTNPTISRGIVMVDAPLERTWQALIAAYDSVGIPVNNSVPGQGILGNHGFKLRRRLKDVALSRYLDCGTTQIGPNSETYEIFLMIKTQLQPVTGGTRAVTSLEASGKPIAVAGNYVNCSSTGRLEARIGELIGGRPDRA